MYENTIFINGIAKTITNSEINEITSMLDDIEDGKVWIDSEEKASRWMFLGTKEDNNETSLRSSDIIDVSIVEEKIRKRLRISKINDILK